MTSTSKQLNTPTSTLNSSSVLATFCTRPRLPSPMVLPVRTAAALATPDTLMNTSWLSTPAILFAATNTLPMRPMMTLGPQSPRPTAARCPARAGCGGVAGKHLTVELQTVVHAEAHGIFTEIHVNKHHHQLAAPGKDRAHGRAAHLQPRRAEFSEDKRIVEKHIDKKLTP